MEDQVQYGEEEVHPGMADFILLIPQRDQWDRAFNDPEEKQSAHENRQPFEGALFQVLEIMQQFAPHSNRFRGKDTKENGFLSDQQQAVDRQNVNHNTPLRGETGYNLSFCTCYQQYTPTGWESIFRLHFNSITMRLTFGKQQYTCFINEFKKAVIDFSPRRGVLSVASGQKKIPSHPVGVYCDYQPSHICECKINCVQKNHKKSKCQQHQAGKEQVFTDTTFFFIEYPYLLPVRKRFFPQANCEEASIAKKML
jgi:hypothetical protein